MLFTCKHRKSWCYSSFCHLGIFSTLWVCATHIFCTEMKQTMEKQTSTKSSTDPIFGGGGGGGGVTPIHFFGLRPSWTPSCFIYITDWNQFLSTGLIWIAYVARSKPGYQPWMRLKLSRNVMKYYQVAYILAQSVWINVFMNYKWQVILCFQQVVCCWWKRALCSEISLLVPHRTRAASAPTVQYNDSCLELWKVLLCWSTMTETAIRNGNVDSVFMYSMSRECVWLFACLCHGLHLNGHVCSRAFANTF